MCNTNAGGIFMTFQKNMLSALGLYLVYLLGFSFSAHAGTPMSDRVAVEAGVKTEIAKDLASPYSPHESLSDRTCLDGRPVDGFQGEIVELWSNLECPYCGIQEPLQAQRTHPDLCIVVRHIPSDEYGESLKKALSYEALRIFSVNAAHRFWDAVLPRTTLGIPVPYEAALQSALQEAAIAPEAFTEALQHAAPVVSADIVAAQSRITSTPTWILEGIRFPACDFKAAELPMALELARKARSGDARAKDEITQIVLRGESMNVHFSSKKHDWATPWPLFQELDVRFGPFELDVCATTHNAKCKTFFLRKMTDWPKSGAASAG